MRMLKRLAGFLGFGKDEELDRQQNNEPNNTTPLPASSTTTSLPPFAASNINHLHRKGFSVPVQVPVDRGPILVPCSSTESGGGVQGLRWFARRLKIDEDGDVADEFFEEVLPAIQENMEGNHKPLPKIEVKCIARPAKVRNQVLSPEGKLQHCVENQGRLQLV